MIPKRVKVRAEWWLKLVRDMPCCFPGCTSDVSDPHHVLKMRPRDDYVVPICRYHHMGSDRALHVFTEWTWSKNHNFNLYEYLLKVMIPRFEEESIFRGKTYENKD